MTWHYQEKEHPSMLDAKASLCDTPGGDCTRDVNIVDCDKCLGLLIRQQRNSKLATVPTEVLIGELAVRGLERLSSVEELYELLDKIYTLLVNK